MPPPLTWNRPGLLWNSPGATWNGTARTRTMSNIKAIIDFSGYTAAELGPVAHTIHDKMTANAATFTTPTVTMATLQTQITNYDAKLIARASNAKADIVAFNDARDTLETSLGVLGNYVNGIAKGDPAIVVLSGFPSYDTARTPDLSPPAAPQNLRLVQGDVSGSMVARYKPDRQGSTNEVQTNTADPSVEANWSTKGMYQGGRAEMDGFTPGTLVWVRVRTVGLKGVMGAWSDPAQIRVI
jgi:hypothetical protein